MQFQEEILDERTLMVGKKVRPSGTMNMRGSEGAARRDVSRAGFRKKGPIQEPTVEKSGKDVPVWVRTHKSPGDYAAHTARKQHREGDKPQSKELKKQFGKTGAKKDSPVHDITVGSPKSKVKDPGQRARQFVGALKGVKDTMKSKKGVATNTPTAIDSAKSKGKKSRSGEEGAEQRGRIYKKLGMGERNPKTGVQMAKLSDSFNGKTFGEFMYECYVILEVNRPEQGSDVEKARWDRAKARQDALENPASMFVGTTGRDKGGNRKYGLKSSERKKEQGKRRSENLKPLTTREIEDHAKRNLHPNPTKTAKKAIRIEGGRKRAQRDDAKTRTQQTGQQYDVDHIQGQPNRRSEGLRSRFQAIHPGDASDNRQVMHGDENRSKNSKNTQRSVTRAGAIRAAAMRALK